MTLEHTQHLQCHCPLSGPEAELQVKDHVPWQETSQRTSTTVVGFGEATGVEHNVGSCGWVHMVGTTQL